MFKPCSEPGKEPGRLSFSRFAPWTERPVGAPTHSRSLAAGSQYRNHHCHVLDGLSDDEHASRDTRALHLKLDELIRMDNAARNSLLNLEEMSEAELEQEKTTFQRLIAHPEATAIREAV